MEFRDSSHPLRARRQERGTQMQRALLLPKSGAGHDTDTRGVEQPETIELVGLAVFLFGLLDCFRGNGDGGEEIHGALLKDGLDSYKNTRRVRKGEEKKKEKEKDSPEDSGIQPLPSA